MSDALTVTLPACFASLTACLTTFSAHCSKTFSKASSVPTLTICPPRFLLIFLLELSGIHPY